MKGNDADTDLLIPFKKNLLKQLILKLVLPLTVILFSIFTKWWYVQVVDGPDEMLYGFPLPFVCSGWHTSMSLQFFISEFLLDFLIYFLFLFVVFFCIHRFIVSIKIPKLPAILLWSIAGIILAFSLLVVSNPDNVFYIKRHFEMEIMETGYKFTWKDQARPDFYKYHPEMKK